MTRRLGAAACLAALLGCGGGAGRSAGVAGGGPPWLEEVAAARGLRFTHVSGHRERYRMPESVGSGVALFDMDGDGDLDAYLVQSGSLDGDPPGGPANRLFRNDGGRFTDVTEGSGTGDAGYGMGVAAGDFDGDGDTDLYVTNLGPNVLLRNDGGGRFTDVTASAGVGDAGWGTSAAFLDHDLDGDLDLFVLNYIHWSADTEPVCPNTSGASDYCSPRNYGTPARDVLYRNDGGGRFSDVSEAAGLGSAFGNGLGVVPADVDGDGRVDVFVANDGTPNQLWINQGDGRFLDRAMELGVAVDEAGVAKAGMGVDAGDVDGDLDFDLVVCNLTGETDSLFRNEGRWFADATAAFGLAVASRPFTRFGLGLVDLDHDGLLDLYEANGKVARDPPHYGDDPYAEPNLILRGGADGRFVEVLPRGGTVRPVYGTSRGAAFGDIDGDGGVDVLVVNRDGPAHLFRNVVPERGNWVLLQVAGTGGADALGATVHARIAGREVRAEVRAARSYLSSSDPRVHLGLGRAPSAEEVRVRWTDGVEERFGTLAAGRVHRLERGRGAVAGRP